MQLYILTANFNSATDLLSTWDSLKSQTFSDFIWLIKDNCSSDGSYELALSIQQSDPRVLVYSSLDSGIYDALNQLVDVIDSNSYYMVLGASDVLFPSSLEYIHLLSLKVYHLLLNLFQMLLLFYLH